MKHRKKRSVWVKPWLQRRNKLGVYHTLLQELRIEAEDEYKKFLRMSPEVFDELLTLVKPEIEKETTKRWDYYCIFLLCKIKKYKPVISHFSIRTFILANLASLFL